MNLKEIVQNPQTMFVDVRSREEFADGSMNAYFLLKQLGLENVHNAGGMYDLLTLKNLN
jgi:rhodanese-related sulfurtransferase